MAAFNILEPINDALQYLHIHANNEAFGKGWHRFFLKPQDNHALKPKGTNWKIHVSAKNPEAIEELVKLAAAYEIPVFKIAGPGLFQRFQNAAEEQSGKTAVFWHYDKTASGKTIDWESFIRDAEMIVEKHGGPGPAVQRDRMIPGSKASYYRFEEGVNGEEYIARQGITQYMKDNNIDSVYAHNLPQGPDPLAHIDLNKPVEMHISPVLPDIRVPTFDEPSPVPLPGEAPRAPVDVEPILLEEAGTQPVVTDKFELQAAGDGNNIVKYKRKGAESAPAASPSEGIEWVERTTARKTEPLFNTVEETVTRNEGGLFKAARNWVARVSESPSGKLGLIAGGVVTVGAVGYMALHNKKLDAGREQSPSR